MSKEHENATHLFRPVTITKACNYDACVTKCAHSLFAMRLSMKRQLMFPFTARLILPLILVLMAREKKAKHGLFLQPYIGENETIRMQLCA